MSQSQVECGTTASMPKHLAIKAQIKHVGDISNRLENLIDRMRGVDGQKDLNQSDAKVAQINPEPSLADVLAMAPDELREHCNRMHDQISMLEDLLF